MYATKLCLCVCRAPHWCITRLWIFADKYCTLTNRRTPKKVHARRRLISGRRGVQGACSSRCPGSGPCGVGRSVTADAGGNVTKLDLSGTTSKLESKCLLREPHYTLVFLVLTCLLLHVRGYDARTHQNRVLVSPFIAPRQGVG